MRPSSAREIAFEILLAVEKGGYASDLLRRKSGELAARDAGLAETIVFGVLRRRAQLDFLIEHFSGRSQIKLDPEVRAALRMGILQLRFLDRIPAHAAVSESVELVKKAGKRSAASLVNAILRKVDRREVKWPCLAVELNVPVWMLARWDAQYGPEMAEGIARAALEEPQAYVNPETGRQQDIGAQAIAPLLDLTPGITLLDLCAAPGNKTAQAIAMGARVVACDRYESRLRAVPEAAARVVLDATQALPFTGKFDRILIDAPCSGTGTLGRNPEIKWRLSLRDLPEFQARQRKMIEQALPLLKADGRMVYATCSLEREENEDATAGFNVRETHTRIPGRDEGDGFFAAVIVE
ncbi:MAG TPA: transcription antitermination factor NusB [Bryobacteraceae bacterium]|nr:transcription antitermination factor NusB [Bryobacteraceae bacterium]